MNEYYHRCWDITIKAIAVGGTAFAFLAVNWKLAETEAARNSADRFKSELEAQIISMDAEYRKEHESLRKQIDALNATKLRHETELSELQLKRTRTPLILVKPKLKRLHSYKAISELRCELAFKNVGDADSSIRTVRVNAYRGTVIDDAKAALELANLIEERDALLARPINGSLADELNQLRIAIQNKQIEIQSSKFPAGGLFTVSASSRNVRWELIEAATDTRAQQITIRPKQAVTDQFHLLLLPPVAPEKIWYRLEIQIFLDDESSQTFAFIIPTHLVTPGFIEARFSDRLEADVYEWSPSAPLMPIEQKGPAMDAPSS